MSTIFCIKNTLNVPKIFFYLFLPLKMFDSIPLLYQTNFKCTPEMLKKYSKDSAKPAPKTSKTTSLCNTSYYALKKCKLQTTFDTWHKRYKFSQILLFRNTYVYCVCNLLCMYFVTNRICIRYTDHWNDNVNKPRNLNRVIGLISILFQHFKMLHYLSGIFFRI